MVFKVHTLLQSLKIKVCGFEMLYEGLRVILGFLSQAEMEKAGLQLSKSFLEKWLLGIATKRGWRRSALTKMYNIPYQ